MDFTEMLEEVNNPKGLKRSQWEPGQSALTKVSFLSTVLSLKISKETPLAAKGSVTLLCTSLA